MAWMKRCLQRRVQVPPGQGTGARLLGHPVCVAESCSAPGRGGGHAIWELETSCAQGASSNIPGRRRSVPIGNVLPGTLLVAHCDPPPAVHTRARDSHSTVTRLHAGAVEAFQAHPIPQGPLRSPGTSALCTDERGGGAMRACNRNGMLNRETRSQGPSSLQLRNTHNHNAVRRNYTTCVSMRARERAGNAKGRPAVLGARLCRPRGTHGQRTAATRTWCT